MSARIHVASIALAAALATLTGCGSDESSDGGVTDPTAEQTTASAPVIAEGPSATSAADTTVPPDAAHTTPVANTATPAAADAPICDTIPTLDAIAAVLGEPLTRTMPLDRGPGWTICDVSGDGMGNVQFGRAVDADLETSRRLAEELGYELVSVQDAGLVDAYAVAGTVWVIIEGVEYSVSAIGSDTIGQDTFALTQQRGAELLATWLGLLGR